jgi:YD repeat-containing protein
MQHLTRKDWERKMVYDEFGDMIEILDAENII